MRPQGHAHWLKTEVRYSWAWAVTEAHVRAAAPTPPYCSLTTWLNTPPNVLTLPQSTEGCANPRSGKYKNVHTPTIPPNHKNGVRSLFSLAREISKHGAANKVNRWWAVPNPNITTVTIIHLSLWS